MMAKRASSALLWEGCSRERTLSRASRAVDWRVRPRDLKMRARRLRVEAVELMATGVWWRVGCGGATQWASRWSGLVTKYRERRF